MTAVARVAVLSRYIVNLYSALTVQLAAEQDNRVVKVCESLTAQFPPPYTAIVKLYSLATFTAAITSRVSASSDHNLS